MKNETIRPTSMNGIEIEIIASGKVIDDDPGFLGDQYQISTWTFRLSPIGRDRWYQSEPVTWTRNDYPYDTEEEFDEQWAAYEAKQAQRDAARQALTDDIGVLLGLDDTTGLTITHAVSEIYTAVQIRKVEPEVPRKKMTVAELLHRRQSMLNAMLCTMI